MLRSIIEERQKETKSFMVEFRRYTDFGTIYFQTFVVRKN